MLRCRLVVYESYSGVLDKSPEKQKWQGNKA